MLKETVAELGTKTTVIERAPFGVLLGEPGGGGLRFSYVNPAFSQQTGFRPEELIGSGMPLLFGPQTTEASMAALRTAVESVQTTELEMVLHRRDGSPLWTRVLLFPTYDDQQRLQHYVACVNDVSEIRRAEEERQRLAGELHESMKLESLGLTIAGIAHDLNTPIGVAITASSHLEQVTKQFMGQVEKAPPTAQELQRFTTRLDRSVELVRNNLNKAAVLVRSFKQTTADATRTEWSKVVLKSFLDTILVSVSPLMRRARCEVTVNCPEQLALRTEPGSLGRALTNLRRRTHQLRRQWRRDERGSGHQGLHPLLHDAPRRRRIGARAVLEPARGRAGARRPHHAGIPARRRDGVPHRPADRHRWLSTCIHD